jgi:hypothetical protein
VSDGWFALHRGWRENVIFKGEYSRADAWVWLIENAAWKPSRTRIKGQSIDLDRGELSFSQRFLAEKWGWSKSRVDRFIADLRDETMIETRSKSGATSNHNAGQGQSIIIICNYGKYQDLALCERGNDNPQNGATSGQRRGKEEQGNKGTIELEEEAIASPSSIAPAKSKRKLKPIPEPRIAMTADWQPGELPPDCLAMIEVWPPGRFKIEVDNTRDYWLDRPDRRPGWDRTFHRWIRSNHDKILRESANDRSQANRNGNPPVHTGRRGKFDGFSDAIETGIFDGRSGAVAGSARQPDDAGTADILPLRITTGSRL